MRILLRPLKRPANDGLALDRPKIVSVITIAERRKRLLSAGVMLVLAVSLATCVTVFWFIDQIDTNGEHIAPLRPALPPLRLKAARTPLAPETQVIADIALPAASLAPDVHLDDAAINIVADKLSDLPVMHGQANAEPTFGLTDEAIPDSNDMARDAASAMAAGNDAEALELYDEILAVDRNNHTALSAKLYLLNRSGDYDGAIKLGNRLLGFYPEDSAARHNLLSALSHSVAPEAEEQLQHMAVNKPHDGPLQAALANRLADEGESDQAIRLLDRAVRAAPTDLSLRLQLATLYDRNDHPAEAFALYRQLLQAAENNENGTVPLSNLPLIKQRAAYLEARLAANR